MSKNIEQRTPEWFASRKGKVTGSVAGAALGLNPYMTASQLIRRMVRDYHNLESEFTGNIATEYGTLHEPMALLGFLNKYGYPVDEVGFFVHPDYKWLGASPDGIFVNAFGESCILEIKCPYGLRNEPLAQFKSIDTQQHYYAQLQIEMACTGLKQAYFYQWSQYADSLEIVTFNKAWFDDAIIKLLAFYNCFLSEIDNPEHLNDIVKTIESKQATALLSEYDQLGETIDNATQRQKEIIVELAKIANNKNAIINGRKLSQITRQGAISYAKAIKDLLPDADLTKYKGQPTTFWKLS